MLRYLATVWIFFLEWLSQRKPKSKVNFDVWMAEHRKTCQQCAFPRGPMCAEANRRLQEEMDQLDLDVSPIDGKPVKR